MMFGPLCPACFGRMDDGGKCETCGLVIGIAKPVSWRPKERTIASRGVETIGRAVLPLPIPEESHEEDVVGEVPDAEADE